jgi:hypothetical protein
LRYTQTKKDDGVTGKGTLFYTKTNPKAVMDAAKDGLNLLNGIKEHNVPIAPDLDGGDEKKGEQKDGKDEVKQSQPLTEWLVYGRTVYGKPYASITAPNLTLGAFASGTKLYADQVVGKRWLHIVHKDTRVAYGWFQRQDATTRYIVEYNEWACNRCNDDGHTTMNDAQVSQA